MLSTSDCTEQQTLWERYNAAVVSYWEMVAAMERVSTPSEFVNAYERAEDVRLLFARALTDLSNHLQRHGCGLMEEAAAR
jgi:hypothetical protein